MRDLWGEMPWPREGHVPRPVSRATAQICREGMDAVGFCSTRLGIEPDARQREILLCGAKRVILNCARQFGKSTMTAALAVFRAMSKPEQMILFASPSERQSAELLRRRHPWRLGWACG